MAKSHGSAVRLARRAILAAPLLALVPARAQALDDSLTGVMRRGVLRVNIGFWTARFVAQPGEAEPRMRDGFHAGMARMIARELGVRAELQDSQQSGEDAHRLLSCESDMALAPPVTRGLLRQFMFCAPHAEMDLVAVGRNLPHDRRGRPSLEGLRLGAVNVIATALADRRTLADILPFAAPWPMARQLLDGHLDAIILSRVMADSLVRLIPEAKLAVHVAVSSNIYAAAIAYGAHDLRRAANTIIEQLRMDDRLADLFLRETGLPLHPPPPA